jgi:dihydrofolate reductase
VAKLVYLAIMSADGYVADADGRFGWAEPDEEVHAFVNDLVRGVGTHLYGRRMYEVMTAWETMGAPEEPPVIRDFAGIWQAADKIVYSTTLASAGSARTRIERSFDPGAIADMKASSPHDISVAGPDLAAQALDAGLVDECHLIIAPAVVGAGTKAFPHGVRATLELADERRFRQGMVYLGYDVTG